MKKDIKILIVDDVPANADYVSRILEHYNPDVEINPEEALNSFIKNKYDLVISDQKMPEMTGLNLIKQCNEISEDFIGLIISAYTDSEDLIDAVNSNILYKYIIKPFMPDILLQHVHRAYEALSLRREKTDLERRLHNENLRLKKENAFLKDSCSLFGLERIAGSSPAMKELKEQIETYATSDNSVLITGETGTGKELVAQAVHELSTRSENPFIKINCTTLSPSLIESELFGHEKGAFTGAAQYKKGFFETADGGTIFLDEIGDIPLSFQPKLLRILQFGTYYPVGGRKEKHTDVRIIAALNKNLENAVENGEFREDLFHRLNRLRLRIPPLRERSSDIPETFRRIYINESHGEAPILTEEAINLLLAHPFHGNVRELETYVYRLLLINPHNIPIDIIMLQKVLEPDNPIPLRREKYGLKNEVENLEKEEIVSCLEKNNYNITKTAESLYISRPGLHNKMKRYGISKKK